MDVVTLALSKKYTDSVALGQGAVQIPGPPGITPHIGANGNWWIGETDTGTKAQGSGDNTGTVGASSWSELLDKPDTFPPSGHGHIQAEIEDFDHEHTIAEITLLHDLFDDIESDIEKRTVLSAVHNEDDATVTFIYSDQSEKIVELAGFDIDYDKATKEFILFNPDGSEKSRVDISDIIPVFDGSTGGHIQTIIHDNEIRAVLLAGSIKETELSEILLNKINGKAESSHSHGIGDLSGVATTAQGTNADNAVRFNAQTLTTAQKTQARNNTESAKIESMTWADYLTRRVAGTLENNVYYDVADSPEDGTLGWWMPDYPRAETVNRISTATGSWTADRDGWVHIGGNRTVSSPERIAFSIGGAAFTVVASAGGWFGELYPVRAGNVIAFTSAPGFTGLFCHFIPPIVAPAPPLATQPHLWPTNGSEVNLGDGTFGRRWTGNIVAAVNVFHHVVLNNTLGGAIVIDTGGYWFTGNANSRNINKIYYATTLTTVNASTLPSFLSNLAITTSGDLIFSSQSTNARAGTTNNSYDVWIRYRKV